MSKYNKPSQDQWNEIEKILIGGGSKTQAAEEVLGSKSKESTIRNAIARGDICLDAVEDKEDNITEEQLEVLCASPDWSTSNLAKRLRNAQRSNNQLRKVQRELFDGKVVDEPLDLYEVITTAVKDNRGDLKLDIESPAETNQCTVEVLFSDLQIGKISESWNTEIAKKAMKYYGKEVLNIVKESKPEKILFCSLGDVIECAHKHKQQSAYSTDSSNAEQLANAISGIWWDILSPLIKLGIPMEIVGVAGNHGADSQAGFDMFKSGRYCYDWTIYSALKDMCTISGADHVVWNIPEGVFATGEIYGELTVWEHGYLCKGSSEAAMLTLKHKRATNLQKFVHRLVVGDMHHYCNYDNGRMQVNGAFFGVAYEGIEYSGIVGFHAVPAQIVNIHKPSTGVGQSTVVETKVIQVAKGY